MLQNMMKLLEDMREDGKCIKKELEKQKDELKELYIDIEDTKASLLEIKLKITLATLEFDYIE